MTSQKTLEWQKKMLSGTQWESRILSESIEQPEGLSVPEKYPTVNSKMSMFQFIFILSMMFIGIPVLILGMKNPYVVIGVAVWFIGGLLISPLVK
jgi:hypothetical protein